MSTKISKRIGHDSMSLSAKFVSGATLKFTIGRGGEKLVIGFSNDNTVARQQLSILGNWLKFKKNETNIQRFDRLEQVCLTSNSGSELIKKIIS